MKAFSILIVCLMIAPSLFGQTTTMQRYIPKERTVLVANITPYKTYNSLDTATTNQLDISTHLAPLLLQMAEADMSDANIEKTKKDLMSPEKIGLDIQKEVYIWVQKGKRPELSDDSYTTASTPLFVNIIIPITDGVKFRGFLDDVFGTDKTKTMIPSGNAMNLVHNQVLINWNKERLIISVSTKQRDYWNEEEEDFKAGIKKDLFQYAFSMGDVTEANSFVKDADFQKHLNKDADFGVWIDYNSLVNNEVYPSDLAFMDEAIKELVGNIKMGGNGFLKKGSADFQLKMYTNEALTRVLTEGYKSTINKDFFKYLDNSNLMGIYTFSMNPQAFAESYGKEIYRVLEKSKEGLMITNVLDIVDIFIDQKEIYTLLKGDLLLAVTDLKSIEKESTDFEYNDESDTWEEVTSTKKEIIPIFSVMMSYGSEENIMKFVKLAVNAGLISKRDEGLWLIGGSKEKTGLELFMMLKNGVLLFTNDENITKNLNVGVAKEKQMSSKDIKEVSSYIQYAYADISKITTTVKKVYENIADNLPVDFSEIEKLISRIEFKTHQPKGNEILTEFNLIMADKSTNVLQTMVDGVIQAMNKQDANKVEEIDIEEENSKDGTKKL